jgi:uncharacterized cupin superfamily protein
MAEIRPQPFAVHPIAVHKAIADLTFLRDRTPTTTAEESAEAFLRLCDYRDGAIFVGRWAGNSKWERHSVGDEIVMVIGGETTITFLTDDGEESSKLRAGDLVVVPQSTWHRFDTPDEVEVLSVTPQPTDHRPDRPN